MKLFRNRKTYISYPSEIQLINCFFLTILLTLFAGIFTAPAQNFNVTSYTLDNGLPVGIAKCIATDKLGYVWVGSDEGLVRTNGYTAESYRYNLPTKFIKYLYPTTDGQLIVVHDKGAHLIVSHQFGKPEFQPLVSAVSTCSDTALQLPKLVFQTSDNTLWFSDECGIIRYSNRQVQQRYRFSEDNFPGSFTHSFSLAEDSLGRLWAASLSGNLFYYNATVDSFKQVVVDENIEWVSSIKAISDNRLWIGGTTGLFEIHISDKNTVIESKRLSNFKAVSDIELLNSKKAIISTGDGRLYIAYLDDEQAVFQQDNLTIKDGINAMYVDKTTHNLWLSTNNGITLLQQQFFHDVGVHNTKIYFGDIDYQGMSIAPDGTPYLVAGNSIYRISETSSGLTYQEIYTSSSGVVGGIFVTEDGIFLETNLIHLLFFDFETGTATKIFTRSSNTDFLNDMAFDNNKNFWMLLNKTGIVRIDSTLNPHFYGTSAIPNEALNIEQFGNSSIFIGSKTPPTYMYRFDAEKDTFINVSAALPDSLPAEFEVTDMIYDKNGDLWIATPLGLWKYTYTSDRLFSIQNIPLNAYSREGIFAIQLSADGSLWLATRFGLLRYRNGSLFLYDHNSGLPTRAILFRHTFIDGKQRLWVGTARGNVYSEPVDSQIVKTATPLLTSITADSLVLTAANSGIKLPYNSSFVCDFFSPTYPTGQIIYEITWCEHQTGDTIQETVTIPHFEKYYLRKGTYTFSVRARQNGQGRGWSKTTSFTFSVQQAWYYKWWAWTLYFTLLLLFTMVIVYLNSLRLRHEKHRLEQLVQQRTREVQLQKQTVEKQKEELAEQAGQLQLNNEKLLELHNFKQSMMSMIVHDMKNPLNALLNISESMPIRQQIKQIKQTGRQMLNMVLNILDISKHETSSMQVEKEKHSIFEIAANAIAQVQFLAENRSIKIKNTVSPYCIVLADAEIIERVVVNLLTNAIKYSPFDETVVLASEILNDKQLQISVSDNGEGIPPDMLESIFASFTQVNARNSGRVRSTGLGLTFCKMAVEAHEGEIGVNSESGNGSEFWFTLQLLTTTSKANSSGNGIPQKSPELRIEEKEYLQQFLHKLRELHLYEVTSFNRILKQIRLKSKAVGNWKRELNAALLYSDQDLYNQVIDKAAISPESSKPSATLLSEQEQKELQPFQKQLKALQVYESSEIEAIVHKAEQQCQMSDGQKRWKIQLMQAVYNMNQEKYTALTANLF